MLASWVGAEKLSRVLKRPARKQTGGLEEASGKPLDLLAVAVWMWVALVVGWTWPASAAEPNVESVLWRLATDLSDLRAMPAVNAMSPFSANGWDRVAEGLAELNDDKLSTAASDPAAFMRSLLAGPERDQYCSALNGLKAGGHLDIPLDLMSARDVAVALAPYAPELAEFAKSHPGKGLVRQMVIAKIDQIVINDRLAAEIDLFKDALTAHVLELPEPEDWKKDDAAWPPDASLLASLAKDLPHATPAALGFRICEAKKLAAPPTPAAALKRDWTLAGLVVASVEKWAAAYTAEHALTNVKPPEPPPPPIPPVVQAVQQVASGGASPSMSLALVPTAGQPGSYTLAVDAVVAGQHVQWPLGLAFDDVSFVNNQPRFSQQALRPTVGAPDAAALQAALRQIGLPQSVTLGRVTARVPTNDFKNITVSAQVTIGGHYHADIDVVLAAGGVSEIRSSVAAAVTKLVADLGRSLKIDPPHLQLGRSSLQVDKAEVDQSLSRAVVSGTLLVHTGVPEIDGSAEGVAASLTVSVPFDGNPVRVIEAKWPPGLLRELQYAFKARLPPAQTGLSYCLGLAGIGLTLEGRDTLALQVTLISDGSLQKPFTVDPLSPFTRIGEEISELAGSPAVAQCVLRQVWPEAAKAVEQLRTASVSVLGVTFAVTDPRPDGDPKALRFKADLIASIPGEEDIVLRGVVLDWPKGAPLTATAIHADGGTLPQGVAERLVRRLVPGWLNDRLKIREVGFGRGALSVDGTVLLPGLDEPIPFNRPLDLAAAQEQLENAIGDALLDGAGRATEALREKIVAQVGFVEHLELVREKSHIGRVGSAIWLRVKLKVDGIEGLTIPLLVEIQLQPSLKFVVHPDGSVTEGLLNAALGPLEEFLGGVVPGGGIKNPKWLDFTQGRYGASFDADIKVAEIVEVRAKQIVVDQHGLSMPDAIGFTVSTAPTPLPPLPLELARVSGTLWRHPAGRFAAGARITLLGDDTGETLALEANLGGDATTRQLTVDGTLSLLTVPMFTSHGVMDFGQGSADVDVSTMKPLSSILNVNGRTRISKEEASTSAKLNLLGLGSTGTLRIDLIAKAVGMHGKAQFSDLAEAEVDLTTDGSFRNPTAGGRLSFGRVTDAHFTVSLSTASLGFRFLAINLKIIAPSVGRINNDVVQHLIDSLFDLRLDLSHLNDITINLVDSQGHKTDDEYGGGSAPADSQQPGTAGQDPRKPEVHAQNGGHGSGVSDGPAAALCAPLSGPEDWVTTPELHDAWIEADTKTKPGWHLMNDGSRIINRPARTALESGRAVACVDRKNPRHQPLAVHLDDGQPDLHIRNDQIAIFVLKERPDALQGLEFHQDSQPFDIRLPGDSARGIFGKNGVAAAGRADLSPLQQARLSRLVNKQLDNIVVHNITEIPAVGIVPIWRGRTLSLFEELEDGQEQVSIANQDDAGPTFKSGSEFFGLLKADPRGPFASLAASVPNLSALGDPAGPLTILPHEAGGCLVVLAGPAGGSTYAVAIQGGTWGTALLADAETVDLVRAGWLGPWCSRLAALGASTELVAVLQNQDASAEAGGASPARSVKLAARAPGGTPAVFWQADASRGSDRRVSPVRELCAAEPDFLEAMKDAVNPGASVPDPKKVADRAMESLLRDMASPKPVWLRHFQSDPAGFMAPCPAIGKAP